MHKSNYHGTKFIRKIITKIFKEEATEKRDYASGKVTEAWSSGQDQQLCRLFFIFYQEFMKIYHKHLTIWGGNIRSIDKSRFIKCKTDSSERNCLSWHSEQKLPSSWTRNGLDVSLFNEFHLDVLCLFNFSLTSFPLSS